MNDLIQTLTSQLGLNEGQAKGGAGLLFKMAQEKLSSTDFSSLSSILGGGLTDLIQAAPQQASSSPLGGAFGKLAGMVGAEKLAGVAELASGFSKLGLDADTVSKFVPVILNYVQEKGGDTAKSLLAKIL